MRGFRQHLAQVSACGDLERGLDGDLHFDANLNSTQRSLGELMVSKWRPSQVKIHSFYVCNGLSVKFWVQSVNIIISCSGIRQRL